MNNGLDKEPRMSKNSSNVEKRVMCYMADMTQILGKNSDSFFEKNEEYIRKRIRNMNHSTRFWLGVKFYRMNENDFESYSSMRSDYTKAKMARMLGIGIGSIKMFLGNKQNKNVSILNLIKAHKHLSPATKFIQSDMRRFFVPMPRIMKI